MLGRSGLAGVGSLLALLAACGETDQERVARQELEVSTTINVGLHATDPWTRAETIRLLAVVRDPRFRTHFDAGLNDPEALVQTAAIEALLRQNADNAEPAALTKLVSGAPEQRLRVLNLVLAAARPEFRKEAVVRALRDPEAQVRLAALQNVLQTAIPLDEANLSRLSEDSDLEVAEIALQLLAARAPDKAADAVIERMHAEDAALRSKGLAQSMRVATPDLWPALRSYARLAEGQDRDSARIALAALGDAGVEDDVRSLMQSAAAPVAAKALAAIVHIESDRAREAPLLYRKDPRPEMRRAALDALVVTNAPLEAFVPLLEDPDPLIGQRTLQYLQQRNAGFAAEALTKALKTSAQPDNVMLALFHASQRMDVAPLLSAGAERLEQLSESANPVLANLATRLLLSVASPAQHSARLLGLPDNEPAIYALLEASLRDGADYSELYTRFRHSDVFVIELAAELGIWRLGGRYRAPESEGS